MTPRRVPGATLAVAAILACTTSDMGKVRMLPRPEPMEVHEDSDLPSGLQTRLADVRRFLPPAEQKILERTLVDLARDPNLSRQDADAALARALDYFGPSDGFCEERLVPELRPLERTGPLAAAPDRIGTAVSIDWAHATWLSGEGRRRYPEPIDLARAIRDGELVDGSFDGERPVGLPGRPSLVSSARALEERGPSAAERLCLGGRPSHSYVIAFVRVADLGEPLRVPTAADAACREHFVIAEAGDTAGRTCTGRPEYVTRTLLIRDVTSFRLSR